MGLAITDSKDENTVHCPECGGDVCEIRSTKRSWTHRSRMIPRLVWIVLVAAFLGYWIYAGMWTTSSRTTGLQPHTQRPQISNLNPGGYPNDEPRLYVSRKDLQAASRGNEYAVESVRTLLERTISHTDPTGYNQQIERVRFAFKESNGVSTKNTHFWSLGNLFYFDTTNMLSDIRDPNSVAQNIYVTSFQTRFSLFPAFQYGWTESGGSPSYLVFLNILLVIGHLGLIIVLTRIIASIGKRLGLEFFHKHWCLYATGLLLLALTTVAVVLTSDEQTRVYGSSYNDVAVSDWFSLEELRDIESDLQRLQKWSKEIADKLPATDSRELLVGQIWDQSARNSSNPANYDTVTIGFKQVQIFAWSRTTYAHEVLDENPPRNYAQALLKFGTASIVWGPKQRSQGIAIWPMNIFGLLTMMYFLWSILHCMSRRVLAHVQKRRVLRNQCIFCSYPLTAQGVNARYPRQRT